MCKGMNDSPQHRLDARGLKCPLPVLKARKALQALQSGEVLEVLASDPAAPKDLANFCETAGHSLERKADLDGAFCFLIKKGG